MAQSDKRERDKKKYLATASPVNNRYTLLKHATRTSYTYRDKQLNGSHVMISAIFILTREPLETPILTHIFREDVIFKSIEIVKTQILNESKSKLPILTLGSTTFIYKVINNLIFLIVLRNNSNISPIINYLDEFIQYISNGNVDNLSDYLIMDNVFRIHKLLDDTICQGYQVRSFKSIQETF